MQYELHVKFLKCGDVKEGFARVRIGIGKDRERDLIEHVLAPLARDELEWMNRVVRVAADAVLSMLEDGENAAMNRFNGLNVERET